MTDGEPSGSEDTATHVEAPLLVERRGAIDLVTLNRPKAMNAIDLSLIDALADYFTEAQDRLDCRVILLRGAGKCFSAGADLNSAAFAAPGPGRAQRQYAMQRRYSRVVRMMRDCPQPIIALLHGAAAGGAFSLVLAADVRIAAGDARMNAAFVRIGLGGGDMGSSYLLPRLVGMANASEILMSGRFVDAVRAKAIGLVTEVVDGDVLLDTGLALAADMLKASPMGLRLTKEGLNAALAMPGLEAAMAFEDRQQVILAETADHAEAVSAFRQRRAAEWRDE